MAVPMTSTWPWVGVRVDNAPTTQMRPSEKDFRRLKSTLGYATSEYLGVQVYEFRVPPKNGSLRYGGEVVNTK